MVETKNVDPGGIDVGTINAPRWRFQLGNHLDSAAMELDEASGILSYEEYHPYGSTAFHTARGGAEVSAKRYRYTGKGKDEETGLYYHGARYYAAWLGRWTAADPAGLVDGLNLYRYSRDNPINFSDPGGTQTCDPSVSSCDMSMTPSSLEEEYQMSSPELHQVDQANLEQAAGMEALREGGVIPGGPFDPEAWRKDVDAKLQGTATTEAKLARDQAVVKAKMAAEEQATRAKLEKIESELPGTGESLVPVWGAAKSATVYFDNGEILAGTVLGTMALSDLLGVKALLTSGGRLLLREGGEAVAEAGGRALAEGGEAAARGPIFADTNVLVSAAEKGNVRALEELRAGTTFVTPNQFREFLDVSTGAQRASRRAFLEAEGIRLFGGPEAGVVASQTDFQLVFRSTVDIVGRGDAALGAFARQTGYEAVTLERRLSNFFNLSRPKLEVPIRRLE